MFDLRIDNSVGFHTWRQGWEQERFRSVGPEAEYVKVEESSVTEEESLQTEVALTEVARVALLRAVVCRPPFAARARSETP